MTGGRGGRGLPRTGERADGPAAAEVADAEIFLVAGGMERKRCADRGMIVAGA